jgi:tRNA dimethylallyltransferase
VEGAQPLAIVLGPTGSGKSELALAIAERFRGEIVNCDSLQLYRMFDIGTAKVTESERRGVPHHLFDAFNPVHVCTAGEYVRLARPILREITKRGHLPVVVGGTGFYLRALLHGLFAGPERNEELRSRLTAAEQRRPGYLHRALRRYDPGSAERIHANDSNKLIRALEVCITARTPMTELFQAGRDSLSGFRPIKFGLNPARQDLYRRLDERCRAMWRQGLVDEVRQILVHGVPETAKPFESIGYKQALDFVMGRSGEAEAIEQMQRDTRRYAKRQLTWFRREPEVSWFSGFGEDSAVQNTVLEIVATHVNVVL